LVAACGPPSGTKALASTAALRSGRLANDWFGSFALRVNGLTVASAEIADIAPWFSLSVQAN
jgi:hypothetical protein